MAETSGFFDAELIEVPGGTDYWDREYLAAQFAKYFSMFIGNGVYGGTANALKVEATGNGLEIVMRPGYAMINGFWYYNDTDKYVTLTPNATATARVDGIMIQYDPVTRKIASLVAVGRTTVDRSGEYELRLSRVTVGVGATVLSNAVVTDDRADNAVCGFVTGLIDVVQTSDLFSQFTAMFLEWFNDMKDQLTTDAAGNLQTQLNKLKAATASVYNESSSYSKGDYALYLDELYVCTTTDPFTPVTGVWNPSKWSKIAITDILKELYTMNGVVDAILASPYSSSLSYPVGSYIRYNDRLQVCVIAQPSGTYNATYWMNVTVAYVLEKLLNSIAPKFSAANTYTLGALVTNYGGLYKCNVSSLSPGNWNPYNWTLTDVVTEMSKPATTGAKQVLKTAIFVNDVFTAPKNGEFQIRVSFTANSGYVVISHSNGQSHQINPAPVPAYGQVRQIPANAGQTLTVTAIGSIETVEVSFFPRD